MLTRAVWAAKRSGRVLAVTAGLFAACLGRPELAGISAEPAAVDGMLVFAARWGTPRGELYTVRTDGTGLRRLTRTPSVREDAPVWSPDGRMIAFAEDPTGPRKQTISVMSAEGVRLRTVTPTDNVSWNPSWSPDGKKIAYDSNRAHGGVARLRRDIYTIDVDGSNLRRLAPAGSLWHSAIEPAWSPNGRQIAFRSWSNTTADAPSVYVMDADGRRLRRLTRPSLGNDLTPAWSPDSKRIAFGRRLDPKIFIIDVATRRLRRLELDGYDPVWSPDGRYIAFVGPDGGIHMARPDGTDVVTILTAPNGDSYPTTCCLDWKRAG